MSMFLEPRPSDSPLVDSVWYGGYSGSGMFMSVAESRWEMVVTRERGKTTFWVRGPETRATPAEYSGESESFGIQFKPGTYMPHFPVRDRIDRNDIPLPEASSRSFWLNGSAWQFPTYENIDVFAQRLVRAGLVVRDPVVTSALNGEPVNWSLRSVQRRFLYVTGMTHSYIQQIERARRALILLQQGASILDTVHETGYFDQPHLTRALKHLVGQTPAQILRANPSSALLPREAQPEKLSF